ncbi:MAG: 4Fe-4S binding protein [Clostridia bacterium]|nr:4Fe-4S binding protein [Clostridia bacterium]
MSKILRRSSQVLFLLLFIALIYTGKIQIWMGVFAISVIFTLFFGRFYCGWICPINTVMNLVTNIKDRLGRKSLSVPRFIKKSVFRYGVLIVFILTFVFVRISGKKLPVLPALLVIGVALTIFFPEKLWHRYLCPYGTILHVVGKLSRRSYSIDDELCISCGACNRICPSNAVEVNQGKYMIYKSECLVCGRCAEKCPENAIKYK